MLSICIPSYNRPFELKRLIVSILNNYKFNFNIEILISDDCSPKQNEISKIINDLKSEVSIRYFEQKNNLGYDKNLIFLANKSRYKYIMFVGDDDFIETSNLNDFLNELSKCNSAFVLSPVYGLSGTLRRKFNVSFTTKYPTSSSLAKLAFESILFSGLVFDKDKFLSLDFQGLENCIYTQVFASLCLANSYGFSYIDCPLIKVGNDGDNGFGHNNDIDSDLKNRNHMFSDFSYHNRLFFVIRHFSVHEKDIIKDFQFLYNLRLINRFYNIRSVDPSKLIELRDLLINNDLSNKLFVNFFYYLFKYMPLSVVRFFKYIKSAYYKYEYYRKNV